MVAAAAEAVAGLSDAGAPGAPLLPSVEDLRATSAAVGLAVALAAQKEGLARAPLDDPIQQIHDAMWQPRYPPLEIV
jgi:malate dehydrogenase (oxaloacetate-decarboxylating)